MQLKKSVTYSPDHYNRITRITFYVKELKDIIGHKITRANDRSRKFPVREGERLSEHVLKSFIFAPLFEPINTFAVDFNPQEAGSQDFFERLGIYLELKSIFYEIRTTDEFDYENLFYNLFSRFSFKNIDYVIQKMESYLKTVKENIDSIYSLAVGLFYGTDTDTASIEVNELNKSYPYLKRKILRTSSGVFFAHLLVIAIESYFSPKLH